VGDFISERVAVERPSADQSILSDVEQALVRYAVEELDGAFTIGRLYEKFKGEVSKRQLTKMAKVWERRGWLTEPRHAADPRRVTDTLLTFIPPTPAG
jgi:hypothetical protein